MIICEDEHALFLMNYDMTAGGPGPSNRPLLTYWNSGVELFLLEVCIKSTLGIVLKNKMVYTEKGLKIYPFNPRQLLNYEL